jgi:hypothetical protein
MEATSAERFVTKNVVYREVLLHRRHHLPPPLQVEPAPKPPTAAVVVLADQPDDLDYTGIYDGIGEEEEEERAVRRTLPAPVPTLPSLSHPLPPNVTLALPPTAREAEVGEYKNIGYVDLTLMPPGSCWHGEHSSSPRGVGGQSGAPT